MMIVGPQNTYTFVNNSATHQGGAVFVEMIDNIDFTFSRSYFIQYVENNSVVLSNDWNTNITFIGNKVKYSVADHAIYATSCQVAIDGSECQPNYTLVNISEVFTIRGVTFDSNTRLQPQIATDGAKFKCTMSSALKIIPGEDRPSPW